MRELFAPRWMHKANEAIRAKFIIHNSFIARSRWSNQNIRERQLIYSGEVRKDKDDNRAKEKNKELKRKDRKKGTKKVHEIHRDVA